MLPLVSFDVGVLKLEAVWWSRDLSCYHLLELKRKMKSIVWFQLLKSEAILVVNLGFGA